MDFFAGIDLSKWMKKSVRDLQKEIEFPYIHIYILGEEIKPFAKTSKLPYPLLVYRMENEYKSSLLECFPVWRDSETCPFDRTESEEERYGPDHECPPGNYFLHANFKPAPQTEDYLVISEGRFSGSMNEEEITWGNYTRTGICIHPKRNRSTMGCLTMNDQDFINLRATIGSLLEESRILVTVQNRHLRLDEDRKAYLIGIRGNGMKPLAYLLNGDKWHVSGSDRYFDMNPQSSEIAEFKEDGIEIFHQDGSCIDYTLSRIVYSVAVEDNIPDLKKARELGLHIMKRSNQLASFANQHSCVAVAGTAGKTTVTILAAQLLQVWAEELESPLPFVYSGAYPRNFETDWSNLNNEDSVAVIETDEHDGSLLEIFPNYIVLTNIAKDHSECVETQKLFQKFVNQLRPQGWVVYNGEDKYIRELNFPRNRSLSFGFEGDFNIKGNMQNDGLHISFNNKEILILNNQNMLANRFTNENLLATVTLGLAVGIPPSTIEVLNEASFPALRFEKYARGKNWELFLDFAHNPYEIKSVLMACKEMGKRTIAVWQPTGYNPLKLFREELEDILMQHKKPEDIIFLTEVFYAGGTVEKTVTSEDIINEIKMKQGSNIEYCTKNLLIDKIKAIVQPNDLIILMGARDIHDIAKELASGLKLKLG
ncbi:MAG: hypothetical protein JXA60_10020 [Candidatus Coatesbacteria bacterium]|nr:hypothetical protein [Candidatus Coatesbacteria bacterium]